MKDAAEEKVLLVKDVGIEKITAEKVKHEKITNILTLSGAY